MSNRRVFKIINSEKHTLGFCWAKSKEDAENFCGHTVAPSELTAGSDNWKTDAYSLALNNALEIEEYTNYQLTDSGNQKVLLNDEFDHPKLYEQLEFSPDKTCFLRLVKLYKTDDECPMSGKKWYGFNERESFYVSEFPHGPENGDADKFSTDRHGDGMFFYCVS